MNPGIESGCRSRFAATKDIAGEFDRLAPLWDEKHGPHSFHRIPLRMLSAYLRDLCASYGSARVLDIGCGTGQQLFALVDRLEEGVGIDISPAMVERARINARERDLERRLSFHVLAAEDVGRERLGVFDLILFVASLEHMPDAQRALARAAGLLQPAGAIVLVMVHPWHPRSFHARSLARWGEIPAFRHMTRGALRRCAGATGLRPADPFGPECLRQVSERGRCRHRARQGLLAPAAFGTYVAVFHPSARRTDGAVSARD